MRLPELVSQTGVFSLIVPRHSRMLASASTSFKWTAWLTRTCFQQDRLQEWAAEALRTVLLLLCGRCSSSALRYQVHCGPCVCVIVCQHCLLQHLLLLCPLNFPSSSIPFPYPFLSLLIMMKLVDKHATSPSESGLIGTWGGTTFSVPFPITAASGNPLCSWGPLIGFVQSSPH